MENYLGIKHPAGAYDQIFITVRQLQVCTYGALSLTRERVCRLQLLLTLASAVILGSESRKARDHILLSQIWDFRFPRLLQPAGLRWRYSLPPPYNPFTRTVHKHRFHQYLYCCMRILYRWNVFTKPLPRNCSKLYNIAWRMVVTLKGEYLSRFWVQKTLKRRLGVWNKKESKIEEICSTNGLVNCSILSTLLQILYQQTSHGRKTTHMGEMRNAQNTVVWNPAGTHHSGDQAYVWRNHYKNLTAMCG
jgi:cytochrome c oxidase assembly factor CtaG